MSFLWVFTILCLITIGICILFILLEFKWDIGEWGIITGASGVVVFGLVMLGLMIAAIIQPFSLRKEMIRQNKEREQIIYQIQHLDEKSDRVKLNEWILTYNDWVNDINTEKQMWGWLSWHYNFDMSNHTIIDLV